MGLPLKPVRPGKFGKPCRKPAGKSFGSAGMPLGAAPPGIFSASAFICSGDGMPPPKPIACAMPAIGPRLPEPIAFIMSAMFRCIFKSLLSSSTLLPAPAAMRFLRLALRISGLLRSWRVIESISAT